mgnify:CR=1 FL=1
MLADFYIPRLSTDMKIAVQKNHLVGHILYRSLVPSKKNGVILISIILGLISFFLAKFLAQKLGFSILD